MRSPTPGHKLPHAGHAGGPTLSTRRSARSRPIRRLVMTAIRRRQDHRTSPEGSPVTPDQRATDPAVCDGPIVLRIALENYDDSADPEMRIATQVTRRLR